MSRETTAEDKAFAQPIFEYMGCVMPKIKPQSWLKKQIYGGRQSQYRYREAHFKYITGKHNGWVKDGHYFFALPTKSDTNMLTDLVCNYLEWNGHKADRIDTKGTAYVDKMHAPKMNLLSGTVQYSEKVKFIPTKTEKGTEDIKATLIHPKHPFGVPWAIEIKANKDRQSEHQIDREERLKSLNMLYDVVKDMDMFFRLYDDKMKLLDG